MSTLEQVRGFLSYPQRIALPPNAIVTVEVVDVSLDAPSSPVAVRRFATGGMQVPIPFTLDYDPARLLPNRHYSLRAEIADGAGALLWTTTEARVLPEPGRPIDLQLEQAGAGPAQ